MTILSQHGNVIAADFRQKPSEEGYTIDAEKLYEDESLLLMRYTAKHNGKPLMVAHYAANLATGHITNL
jgi:hypothetical protein